jgi:hypothetical protein
VTGSSRRSRPLAPSARFCIGDSFQEFQERGKSSRVAARALGGDDRVDDARGVRRYLVR